MSIIISVLIEFLNRINKIIWKFIIFLSKFIKVDDVITNNKPTNEKYKQFKVDDSPLIEPFTTIEHKDYKKLIKEKNIKPINRRNGKSLIPDNIKCPCCSAPKDYLYDNTGKQTQFECKVCHHIFSNNPHKQKDVVLKCPHCEHHLVLRKQRTDYDVYVCKNNKCRYYLKCIIFIVNFISTYFL